MKKLTSMILLSSVLLGGLAVGTMNASEQDLGWIPGQPDPSPGQTIKGEDNASVAVSGWVGEWTPVDPEDKTYVDITVPTTVRYANAMSEDGKILPDILSPLYTITNNSKVRDVMVEVASFSETGNSGVKQDLFFTPVNEAGVRLQSAAGQFLDTPTHLATIGMGQSKYLKFEGEIAEGFKADEVIKPSYTMTFNFTALKN